MKVRFYLITALAIAACTPDVWTEQDMGQYRVIEQKGAPELG